MHAAYLQKAIDMHNTPAQESYAIEISTGLNNSIKTETRVFQNLKQC